MAAASSQYISKLHLLPLDISLGDVTQHVDKTTSTKTQENSITCGGPRKDGGLREAAQTF